ncbi:MAG: TonB family protein [Deltaproteobacteria bacterium]|nr:TonB family protein [Deltaproteobacteria bacterium]
MARAATIAIPGRYRPDPFEKLFGFGIGFSVLLHAVFFLVLILAGVGSRSTLEKTEEDVIWLEPEALPVGPTMGSAPQKAQTKALNPFPPKAPEKAKEAKKEEMAPSVKPTPQKVQSKRRSYKTRETIVVKDKMRESALDKLRSKNAVGGGTGDSDTKGKTNAYANLVWIRVSANYYRPRGIPVAAVKDKRGVATLKISPSGNLVGISIASSGVPELDEAFRKAARTASPFPAPPNELVATGMLTVKMGFTGKQAK